MKRERIALALTALTLIGAGPAVTLAPSSTAGTAIWAMPCSTVYGCEIDTPPFETVTAVSLTDQHLQYSILVNGGATGAHVKLLPSVATTDDGSALRAEADVVTDRGMYRVLVTASRTAGPHVLAFTPPPTPAPAKIVYVPTATASPDTLATSTIDISKMDFSWKSEGHGSAPCTTVFSDDKYQQLYCKIPDAQPAAPIAYRRQGRATIPLNSTMLRTGFIVIEGLSTPVLLEWPNGQEITIDRR